ncbi:MAG: hypothetical protein ABI844_18450 [Saprospiraceae bacterium]
MKVLISLLFAFFSLHSYSQRVMAVQTPSFQRELLWYSCNYTKQDSLLRIPPRNSNTTASIKLVDEKPVYKQELVNLVNVSNEAFEGVSQKLIKPMEKFKNYKLYFSASRDTSFHHLKDEVQYKKRPLKLYVFGSDGHCGFNELLAAPFNITNHRWDKYVMTLRATKEWSHIIMYAAYDDGNESDTEKNSESYLMISQHGPLQRTNSSAGRRKRTYDPGVFRTDAYSTLSFGGLEMMYEITPKAITVFSKKNEIIVSDTLRKDLSRSPTLDGILEKFRGIDFLFLVMKEKKYRDKRLNIISYLKTKYPEILEASKVMKYSSLTGKRKNRTLLKKVYDKKDEDGDLLIIEKVQEFVK